jgi:hypothetical protein
MRLSTCFGPSFTWNTSSSIPRKRIGLPVPGDVLRFNPFPLVPEILTYIPTAIPPVGTGTCEVVVGTGWSIVGMTITGVNVWAGIKVITAVANVYLLGLDGRKLETNRIKPIYNKPPRTIAPRRIQPKEENFTPGYLFI